MSAIHYVLLDPTGNLTALVTDPVPPARQAEVTRELLRKSEQVAYLHAPARPDTAAGIRLMGGEFCGNAAMASAAWLVREHLSPGAETTVRLEVSGAAEPVDCRIRALEDGFEGTVRMPRILEVFDTEYFGVVFTAVRMEGILHLIRPDDGLSDHDAEFLLKKTAPLLPDGAVGLLQWNRETGFLRPLVYVRGSQSLVWENGCGSGSAAVGAAEALRTGRTEIRVSQPGGTIRVRTEKENGAVRAVFITGRIRIGQEGILSLSD